MLDDFRLRVFMMVAAEGSFTRAAQHLGVSQPAVSQNIAELEKQVGAVLFDRKRGEVTLTPEGYVFKDYAAKILHWYDPHCCDGLRRDPFPPGLAAGPAGCHGHQFHYRYLS